MTYRWLDKATTFCDAYARVMGGMLPSASAARLCLAVAELESRCGDALAGNWGATTRQHLSSEDLTVLHNAGLSAANPADLDPARELLGVRSNLVLGRDQAPNVGWYWIWFYRPLTPVDGATYFVKILIHDRVGVQHVLADPVATSDDLARAMYASNYYTGTHDPTSTVVYKGTSMTGAEANIRTYADAIASHLPSIVYGLVGWTPSLAAPCDTTAPPFDLMDMAQVHQALLWLGPHVGVDFVAIDDSTVTVAVERFQTWARLNPDGIVGPLTRGSLKAKIERALASS